MKAIKILIFLTLSLPCLASKAAWVEENLNFRHRHQERNPWWGCRNAEPLIERLLELMEARNIEISCWDTHGRSYPAVDMRLRFDRVSTFDEGPVDYFWKNFSFSSNRDCSFYSNLIESLMDHFETRNRYLMSSCQGEQGQLNFQAEVPASLN